MLSFPETRMVGISAGRSVTLATYKVSSQLVSNPRQIIHLLLVENVDKAEIFGVKHRVSDALTALVLAVARCDVITDDSQCQWRHAKPHAM
ncbi:hypothetical protein Pelo_1050 [Pelomyxa schiedti]|nr:hypothetical protein Pelo_1050 [Pelomyxa schiedti]